jgi:hypothetical protein
MNLSQLQFRWKRQPSPSGVLGVAPRHRGALPRWGHVFSRFLRSVAGPAVAGVILCSTLLPQARADASDPTPIVGGNYFLGSPGPLFHVFGPGFGGDPTTADLEPSTITDFDGVIGVAYISGMVTETNTTTGEKRRLPFMTADMRFMQGVFLDANGQVRQGTFALV